MGRQRRLRIHLCLLPHRPCSPPLSAAAAATDNTSSSGALLLCCTGAGASTAQPLLSDVEGWDAAKVSDYVSAVAGADDAGGAAAFGTYASALKERGIDGRGLLALDEAKMRDLGVGDSAHLQLFAENLQRIRESPAPPGPEGAEGEGDAKEQDEAATKLQARMRMKTARKTMAKARMTMRAAGTVIKLAKRVGYLSAMGVPEDELKGIQECFERYDTDKGGFVDPAELAAAIHDLGEDTHAIDPDGRELHALFASIDRDSNQKIDQDEFLKWWCEGGDDMDSNFLKWWFKTRWHEVRKQPDFLATPVKPNVAVAGSAAADEAPLSSPRQVAAEAAAEAAQQQVAKIDVLEGRAEHSTSDAYAQGDLSLKDIAGRIVTTPVTDCLVADGSDGKAPLTMRFAALSQRGYYPESLNKANQDAYIIDTSATIEGGRRVFCVADGHGTYGDYCSIYVKDNICANLDTMFKMKKDNDDEAITAAFRFTDQGMHCKKDNMSGTTGIAIIVEGDGRRVVVPNVGDSRAIVCHRNADGLLKASALSLDQTPYRRDERDRVKKTGCRVMNMDQLEGLEPMHDDWDCNLGDEIDDGGDPPRIWHPKKNFPGTAFTRSLGDQVAIPLGVICDPEIGRKDLHPDDELLIVASDGVFEFLTNQTVADMVNHYEDPLEACRHVVAEAYRMWMIHDVRTDDITMICIQLKWGKATGATSVSPRVTAGLPAQVGIRPTRRGISKAKKRHIAAIHHQRGGKPESPPFVLAEHTVEKSADELAALEKAVKGNFLFEHLTAAQRTQALACMELETFEPGAVIIKQGDEGKHFYVIKEGSISVHVADSLAVHNGDDSKGDMVHTYVSGKDAQHSPCFGEIALMHGHPRAATLVAGEGASAWRMGEAAFKALLLRSEHRELVEVLHRVRVLRALHGSQVDRMADLLAEVAVAPGASVMEVGDEVTDFVVIKAGAVVSTRPVGGADGDSGETVDTQLGRYDFFNEEALLDDGRKSRTSIKAGPEGATLMRLDRKQFLQLLGDHSIDQYIAEAQQRRAVLAAQQVEAQAAEGSASAVALSTLQRLPPLAGPGDSTDVSTETGLCRFDDANLLTLRVVSKSRALRLQQESELVKERALLKTLPHDDVCSHLFPELLCTDSDTKCLYSLYHFPAACSLAELMDSNGDGVAALGAEGARFVSAALLLATKRAHELGMLLRSIAPEGIMMDGANGYPRLYDLRVAKVRVLPPQMPPASMYGSARHSIFTNICPPPAPAPALAHTCSSTALRGGVRQGRAHLHPVRVTRVSGPGAGGRRW